MTMGLFDSFFGKAKPAPAVNPIRDTLFGDMPVEYWPPVGPVSIETPWNMFEAARSNLAAGNSAAAIEEWRKIIQQPNLESRQHLQAWHFLRQNGQQPPPEKAKQVLGVVIEVGMPNGLDLLAAYTDRSARYYNYSGAGVIWEHPDGSLDSPINKLLVASKEIVDKIGPWELARPTPPPRGQVRLNFLTPSGLHFGQAPMTALSRDLMAGRVLQLGMALMQALMAKTNKP